MSKGVIIAIVLVLVLGAGAFILLNNNADSTVSPTPQATIAPITEQPTDGGNAAGIVEENSNIVELPVGAGSYFFDPEEIRVQQGDTVRITLTNVDETGNMMHDFVLDEFGVQSDTVGRGESTTFEFVASEVGEFEYYCGVGDHREMGQVGTLIVE